MTKKFVDCIAEENGKYYIKANVNGKTKLRLVRGAKSRSQAQASLDALRYKMQREYDGYEKFKEKKIYSAEFLFNNMLKYSKNNKKSFDKDKSQAKILLKYFKDKGLADDISKIRQKDILQLQLDLKNTPTSRGDKRANSTVNKYIACLKTAFNLMVKDESMDINFNPCIGVTALMEDNRRETYLPKNFEEEFLSYLPEYLRDMVELDLSTGVRIGNVRLAEKSQFNLATRYWRIQREYNKGKKDIKIKLNNKALSIVKKYYFKTDKYLFVNPLTNKPYTTNRKAFKAAAIKVGIPDLQMKDLRRTVGTWLHQKGKSLRVIRDVLWQSNVSTTERYLGVTASELDEAYDSLDD